MDVFLDGTRRLRRGRSGDAGYLRDGERRAAALGNRGPIRFTDDGKLAPDILEAYWRCGFYIFEGVLKPDELDDIERDMHDDARPAAGRPRARRSTATVGRRSAPTARRRTWAGSKPLGDPVGGTAPPTAGIR